jgi:hypothetical protein
MRRELLPMLEMDTSVTLQDWCIVVPMVILGSITLIWAIYVALTGGAYG